MTRKFLLICGVFALLLVFVTAGSSQLANPSTTVPSWVGNLVSGTTSFLTLIPADDPIWSDPATAESANTNPASMPKGSPYKLFGTAQNGIDPQTNFIEPNNPFNDVISFDTQSAGIAGALRILGDHVQVKMLTNQIELKYYLRNRTCGGGSPRFQLAIDGDGDGNFKETTDGPDHNIFGYLGDTDGFQTGNCAQSQNHWIHEDMTDVMPKWGLDKWVTSGKFPVCALGYFNCRWDEVVRYFQTNWPDHRVLNAVLVDDSTSFTPTNAGCAYFDLVNTGARTYTNRQDATGNGNAPNNCP